jgi:hypothetical protein
LQTIGRSAFFRCISLASVAFPDALQIIEQAAFLGCSSLASVAFPDALQTIGAYAFDGCSSLASVAFPDALQTIGDWAFDGCDSLTTVAFPDALQTIGVSAFYGCSSLASVTFPDALQTIGARAFYECSSLASVTFGDGLQTIGRHAFYLCPDVIIFCRPGLTIPDFPEERVNRTVHAALTAFLDAALSARRPEGLMRYAMRNRLGGRMSLLVTQASIDTNRPTLAALREALADIEHEATRRKIKDWALGQLRDINIHEYGGM